MMDTDSLLEFIQVDKFWPLEPFSLSRELCCLPALQSRDNGFWPHVHSDLPESIVLRTDFSTIHVSVMASDVSIEIA